MLHSNKRIALGEICKKGKLFSGKHKLYGYKFDVAVRPNGMASAFSKHFAGSVSDISIMHSRIDLRRNRFQKSLGEEDYEDEYLLSNEYPSHWAGLMDKGYQSASEALRAITPKKKPHLGIICRDDDVFNKNLSSDRILVENFFGRLCQLWSVLSTKFVWSETMYDTIFSLGIFFTNFHISIHRLRDADGCLHNRYRNRLDDIGETKKRKRLLSQEMYRKKRKLRLSTGYRSTIPHSDDETVEANNELVRRS